MEFPVCNEANYLRDTLDSLIENYEDIYEIIISDNFSDDSTEIICKEYEKYSKIKYIRQEKESNSIENFNSGLVRLLAITFMKRKKSH